MLLMPQSQLVRPDSWRGANAFYIAKKLGLATNLKLCLDAGEAASYISGQKWLDLSGNGYDFFRGADVTATTDDPTFNGVVGRLSIAEYWSFDGGDYFRYDTTNEAWMENLHKAGAKFTIAFWLYPADTTLHWVYGDSANDATKIGVSFKIDAGFARFKAFNGSVAAFDSTGVDIGSVAGAWQFIAISVDSAASAFFTRNAVSFTPTSGTYTSPSAAASTYTAEIGSAGNGSGIIVNGSRLGMFAAWESRALKAGELTAFFNATRGRYGV